MLPKNLYLKNKDKKIEEASSIFSISLVSTFSKSLMI